MASAARLTKSPSTVDLVNRAARPFSLDARITPAHRKTFRTERPRNSAKAGTCLLAEQRAPVGDHRPLVADPGAQGADRAAWGVRDKAERGVEVLVGGEHLLVGLDLALG